MKYLIVFIALAFSTATFAQEIYKYNDNHAIKEGQTLYLSSNDANVNIKGSDQKQVSIEIYREAKGNMAKKEEFRFEFEEKNGDLFVTEKRKRSNVNFMGYLTIKEYTIDITLPHNVKLELEGDDDNYNIENIDGEIDIAYEDGNINIIGSKTPKIKITGDDGNIDISDFNGDFKTSFEDGNLTMNNCNINSFDVRIDDGNINLTACQTGNTHIKTSDGNVNLDIVKGDLLVTVDDGNFEAQDVESENIDIKGYDGNVTLGLHMKNQGNYKIKMDDGDVDVELLSGGGTIKVRCDDGDVKLRSRDFQMVTDENHYKEIKTDSNGNGKMEIKIEDGDVSFSK